jgi:hypothetical protein
MLLVAGCERKVTNEVVEVIPPEAASYVGSEACGACHSDIYASFIKTGHPYKLNEADSVQMPGYFPDFVTPLEIPPDLSWGQIDKIIGGFWWKARYIEPDDGAIYIGPDRQYNLIEGHEGFVPYDGTTPGFKDYNCGPCHTTGYRAVGNQEGKDSLIGTWAFNGIQCEECHGAGELHVISPYDNPLLIDWSSEQCGACHFRTSPDIIPASNGFIKHHEQWNEMFATKHLSIQCVSCHNPHYGLHPNNPDRMMAIINKCENCHLNETQSFAGSDLPHYDAEVACIDCHMPRAAKSAVQQEAYVGDVRSHLMKINIDPTATLMKNESEANPYLTVEYTCLRSGCHDPDTPGNTKSWAAANADRAHARGIDDLGSCFFCHSDADFSLIAARQQHDMSGHATGSAYNINRHNDILYIQCEGCHTNEGFVADATGVPAAGDQFTPVGCYTCHEPHTTGTLSLRVEDPVMLADGTSYDRLKSNICAACHQSRRNVNTYVVDNTTLSNSYGPHLGPHSDMFLATNAYEYDGYSYDHNHPHGLAHTGCLWCHEVPSLYATGGHTFGMKDEDTGYENVTGCNYCHGGDVNDFDHEGEQTDIVEALDSLGTLLLAANLLELVDIGGVMVPLPTEGRVVMTADSAGAVFNYIFVRNDGSKGMHNIAYAEDLLQSSIEFMNSAKAAERKRLDLLSTH